MLAYAIIDMHGAPNEGCGSVSLVRLRANLVMDALIRDMRLLRYMLMVSSASMLLFF